MRLKTRPRELKAPNQTSKSSCFYNNKASSREGVKKKSFNQLGAHIHKSEQAEMQRLQ